MLKHFVVVFDRRVGTLRRLSEYPDSMTAMSERFRLEAERDPAVEIVVLSARSRAELVRTHARYFKSLTDIALEDLDELAPPPSNGAAE